MKDVLRTLFLPIIGMIAMGTIFVLVVWGGSWYDEVINDRGRIESETSGTRDLGGYATLTITPECDDSYYPVCGLDGVTYGNACKAVRAGTTVTHRGVCEV